MLEERGTREGEVGVLGWDTVGQRTLEAVVGCLGTLEVGEG